MPNPNGTTCAFDPARAKEYHEALCRIADQDVRRQAWPTLSVPLNKVQEIVGIARRVITWKLPVQEKS